MLVYNPGQLMRQCCIRRISIENGQSLNADEERCKAERRKERKKNPKSIEEDHSESDDCEEEEPELIKWELEWWRKEGAGIIN